jgi:hypothetical protein
MWVCESIFISIRQQNYLESVFSIFLVMRINECYTWKYLIRCLIIFIERTSRLIFNGKNLFRLSEFPKNQCSIMKLCYSKWLQSNQFWKSVLFQTSNTIFREENISSHHQDLYRVSCSSKSVREYFPWSIDIALFYLPISTLEINNNDREITYIG